MISPSLKSLSEVTDPYLKLKGSITPDDKNELFKHQERLLELLDDDSELSKKLSDLRKRIQRALKNSPRKSEDKDGNTVEIPYDNDHFLALLHCCLFGLSGSFQRANVYNNPEASVEDWKNVTL